MPLSSFHFSDALEILILSVAIYAILRFIRNTRGSRLLQGLVNFLILSFFCLGALEFLAPGGLGSIKFILSLVAPFLAVIIVILFQEEIRVGISRFSQSERFIKRFSGSGSNSNTSLMIATSCKRMALQRTGALIAIERQHSLKPFCEHGVKLQLPVSSMMLETIFFPSAPMHDGAVLIRGQDIFAAKCVLPMTTSTDVSSNYGTRHRAALGLSEKTDAVVIVVSEENGEIGFAVEGQMHKPISHNEVETKLDEFLSAPTIDGEESAQSSKGEGDED
ncbi:MAG: diadenylate cyclase CdaA [Planctomycetota bacterium]|jgi:diadenylate cyclase|nr:diadenylate cyclase CdaA [Planctomycetota bacterium]